MKVILFLFYNFCKLLIKISFRIFYEKVVFLNRDRLRIDNPCIMVSNHPSTMTDPLHVAHNAKRMSFFLANAGLFKSAFGNWFFSNFYCIPIERPEDVEGRRISNEDSFAKADKFLLNGGLLYIAPEGYSQKERRLGKVKTGATRIALSAENKANFKLGLTIQPVGLNYSAHTDFRSKLFMIAGPPIEVADYQKIYEKDPREAVTKLTADLSDTMRTLIIDTEDEAEDQLLKQLEELLANSRPVSLEDNFFRNKKILNQLRIYRSNFPSDDTAFRQKVKQYFEELAQHQLKDLPLWEEQSATSPSLMGQGLLFLLGLPFFLYGWINNFLANYIPSFINKKMGMYIGYASTIKLMSALLIYPLIYGLQIFIAHQLFHQSWITGLYFLTLAPLGLFAWSYRRKYKTFLQRQRWNEWSRNNLETATSLLSMRKEIVEELLEKVFVVGKVIA